MPQEKIANEPPNLSRLRHDLRSKLNGILGFGQLLQDSALTPEQQHHLKKVLGSGEAMLTLIDQLETSGPKGANAPVYEDPASPEQALLKTTPAGSTVLIVDDEVANLELLVQSLGRAGFQTLTAQNRKDALALLDQKAPNLILLDVRMPDVSGFDLCREIHARTSFENVPVIFLSGASEIESRLKAYEAGGVDYILKPFYAREVIARVCTQVALVQSQEKLRRYAQSLEQLVAERTSQMIHQDRMASLGLMSAGIVHEINNPVTFIKGNLALLRRFDKDLKALREALPSDHVLLSKVEFISREFPQLISEMDMGAERIRAMVHGLKCFSRQESTEKEEMDLVGCIESSLQLAKGELKRYKVNREWSADINPVLGNTQQISQVFVNLFVNASHAMRDLPQGILTVQASNAADGGVDVRVQDSGCGMSAETLNKIWLPFFTTKPKDIGTGLGLSIVYGILEDHKGTVSVTSQPGEGTCFLLHFPPFTAQERRAVA